MPSSATDIAATGAKSLIGSYGSFISAPEMACVVRMDSSVWPSGFALATYCVPMRPSAPGRLSTSTGCFSASDSLGASNRAATSDDPPEYGTTIRIGRFGYWPAGWAACATVDRVATNAADSSTALAAGVDMRITKLLLGRFLCPRVLQNPCRRASTKGMA